MLSRDTYHQFNDTNQQILAFLEKENTIFTKLRITSLLANPASKKFLNVLAKYDSYFILSVNTKLKGLVSSLKDIKDYYAKDLKISEFIEIVSRAVASILSFKTGYDPYPLTDSTPKIEKDIRVRLDLGSRLGDLLRSNFSPAETFSLPYVIKIYLMQEWREESDSKENPKTLLR